MGEMATAANLQQSSEEKDTKLLGAHVSADLHREFKTAATMRGEDMKEAMVHAARLYIESGPNALKGGKFE